MTSRGRDSAGVALYGDDDLPAGTMRYAVRGGADWDRLVAGLGRAVQATPRGDGALLANAGDDGPVLEWCDTTTMLGTRYASRPLKLAIPSHDHGDVLRRAVGERQGGARPRSERARHLTTTGDGGMSEEKRAASKLLVYQCFPSRYGFDPGHLRAAGAMEVVIGRGAEPGGGGMLPGQKVSERRSARGRWTAT